MFRHPPIDELDIAAAHFNMPMDKVGVFLCIYYLKSPVGPLEFPKKLSFCLLLTSRLTVI